MDNFFKDLFSSEYDGDPGFIRLIRVVLTLATAATTIIAVVLALTVKTETLLVSAGIVFAIAILAGISLFMSFRNVLWLGKGLLPLTILIGVTFLAINANGLHDSAIVGFTFVIIITSLITGQKALPLATVLTVSGVWIVAYADLAGITRSTMAQRTGVDDIVVITVIQIISAVSLNGLMNRLNAALEASRLNEQVLEQRVADRTQALSSVAEVGTAASTMLETDKLLQQVVDLTKERFAFYHAHIYLLNEAGDTLVLASGAGEPGRQMVAEGRSIPLDREQSLVARAAREKKGVTVNDVTMEPDFLSNPLLPDTRSELAVPMMIGEKAIGVFDVQSEVVGRFTDADIAVQTTLASQVASAVQNARLYTRAETVAQEAQSLVDNAPEAIVVIDLTTSLFVESNQNAVKLYGLDREELAKVGPAHMSPPTQPDGRDSTQAAIEKISEAIQGKTPVFDWVHRNAQGQDIPCEVRLVRMPGEKPRVRASVTDITERQQVQQLTALRARQQEAINFITQKIQSATTVESALQIAARELGQALGEKSTLVTLAPSALAISSNKDN